MIPEQQVSRKDPSLFRETILAEDGVAESSITVSRQATIAQHRTKRWRSLLDSVAKHAVLLGFSALFLVPWVWMLLTSLKTLPQIFVWPPVWWPTPIVWANYPRVFAQYPFWLYGANTMIIATATVTGSVISNTLIAYSLSRLRWRGQNIAFVLVLATMMVPYQVTMIPLYIVFRNLNWLNSYLPLIVPSFFGNPYFVFLLRQFFNTIPQDLVDVAGVEGANEVQVLWSLILPLAKPAIAVVALFQFIGAWGDFLAPLIYINESAKFTIAIGLREMQNVIGISEVNLIMAASTMTILPIILVFFFAQRTFIQGIALTGIKG